LNLAALISEPRDATNTAPSYVTTSWSKYINTSDPIDTRVWSKREYTLDALDTSNVTSNKDLDGDVNEEIKEDIDNNVILNEDEASHCDYVAVYINNGTLATTDCNVNITNKVGLHSTIQ
jgi:hypothetical protein